MAGRLLVFTRHCHPGRGAARKRCSADPGSRYGPFQVRKRDPRLHGDDNKGAVPPLHCPRALPCRPFTVIPDALQHASGAMQSRDPAFFERSLD